MFKLKDQPIKNTLDQYSMTNSILNKHIDSAMPKVNKGLSVIKKLRRNLSRKSSVTIYKAFLRPLLDCSDTIYD